MENCINSTNGRKNKGKYQDLRAAWEEKDEQPLALSLGYRVQGTERGGSRYNFLNILAFVQCISLYHLVSKMDSLAAKLQTFAEM